MKKKCVILHMLLIFLTVAMTSGCSSVSAPKGFSKRSDMKAAANMSDTLVYVNQEVDQKKFTRFILEPVVIYDQEDNDFGAIDIEDRKMMSGFIKDAFIEAFKNSNFPIINDPGTDVLRVKFTLIGLTRSLPVVQGVNYLAFPMGTGIQIANGVFDKSGTFMGNAIFAAEFYDSTTDEIVAAVITKQSANALNFKAAFSGKYGAAKAGITEFMETMRKQADEQHGFKTD